MRELTRLFVAVNMLLPSLLQATETRLLRHPTYYNGNVAFSYLGDIWSAKDDGTEIRRLTVHTARDVFPRFSPDGRWVAFSSNRRGNYDVFVMPRSGGQAKQLTFHSAHDTVVGWTPDSRRIIFQSARGLVLPRILNLYEVPLDGGVEQPIPTERGYWASYSADGRKLAFNRHAGVWWRQHYRGAHAADLWVMETGSRKFLRLSGDQYKGNWYWPMYGAKSEIYFVADRLANERSVKPGSPAVMSSVNNIWKIADSGGTPVQVTRHTSGQLFFPSISSDGRVIVYEENFGLWKLDTSTGKSTEIRLNLSSDEKENAVETIAIHSESDGFSLSPTGSRMAISARGAIFTVSAKGGAARRITNSPYRDINPSWSPDGKWIAFISDRSGREEIWIVDEFGGNLRKLSDSDTEKSSVEWGPDGTATHLLEWAPDSRSLLYTTSDHKLYRALISSGANEVVTSSDAWNVLNPRFSPDGRWISYTKLDQNMRPHVYVIATSGGKEHHIARSDLFSETGARWTVDGNTIVFLAGTTQGGANPGEIRTTDLQVHDLNLIQDRPSRSGHFFESDRDAQAAQDQPAASAGKPNGVIDWEKIASRTRQLARLDGNVVTVVPSPDGKTYAVVTVGQQAGRAVSAIYLVSERGDQVRRIAASEAASLGVWQMSPPQFSRDGRTLYYLDRSAIYAIDTGNREASLDPASGGRRLEFQIRMEIDRRAERRQMFAECWRVLKNHFYDPDMHGADWEKVREIYEPLTEHVSDQEEMDDLLNRMVGELNSSHTGIARRVSGQGPQTTTHHPGFEIEPNASGRYRVSRIYKSGPADRDFLRIKLGDYILAVNGHELKSPENYWRLYNAAWEGTMDFEVNSSPTREGAWHVKIEPVSGAEFDTLIYTNWVRERSDLVEKLSGGRIAYAHLRAMAKEPFLKFEREVMENHFKKALIIDVRFNSGGALDQVLLPFLLQRQYGYSQWRGSVQAGRPQRAFYGPLVAITNEVSHSNAEMFADGFRSLGLGRIIGTPTYGGVISTGSRRLIDGSAVRIPNAGIYNVKGYNLENYGVPPDIYVDNTPEDFLNGRDRQLEKAVEILAKDL